MFERLQPGLCAAEDQGVDVMGALVGVHRLEVLGVPHHVVFRHDPVAAMHVAGHPRDLQRLAAIVPLHQRDDLGRAGAFVQHPARPERTLQPQRDLRLHVGELLLVELRLRQRRPNCTRSSPYWRARCQQSSAAPITPQAMP
jgi:hypothetical protein